MISIGVASRVPRNGAAVWLPTPLFVVGIRPSISLTSDGSAKIWTSGVIERVGLVVNPLSGR